MVSGLEYTPLSPTKTLIRDNKIPSQRQSFLRSIVQKPCFVISSVFVISIYCFVAKYTTTLAENGENLISAQPPISAHSQGPKSIIRGRFVKNGKKLLLTLLEGQKREHKCPQMHGITMDSKGDM